MTATPANVGRYHIVRLIAHGGMGSLYLARDPAIDRLIAIKLLKHGFDDENVRDRFAREARATGGLRHPNIVTIFDVGEHEHRPFIAMEYVPGETLEQLIRQRAALPLTEKLGILEELCSGLHYAHRAGIVHRDIKPANVILDIHGTLKILDFGIARLGESGTTQAGDLIGTLNYMAPEQVVGERIDHRVDVYAVGVLAYELLTYEKAFPGTLHEGALFRILHSAPAPLDTLLPGIDSEIPAIVERAMARQPDDRYQDLEQLRNDLGAVRSRLVETGPLTAPIVAPDADTSLDPIGAGRRPRPQTRKEGQSLSGASNREPSAGPPLNPPGSATAPSASMPAGSRAGSPLASASGQTIPVSEKVARGLRTRARTLAVPAGVAAVAFAVIFGIWIAWRGVSDVPRAGETPAATIPSAAPPPPAADAGASSDRTEKPAVSEQLRSLHDTARQQISAGRREEALDTVNAGLVLDASDPELNRLLDGFIDAAGQLAGQARLTAVRRGATDASSPEFREARADERNGVAFQKSGDRAQAVRALWAAAARYERAGELAARSTAARPVPPEAKSRPESAKEKVSTQPAPRQEQLPRQQVESLTRLPGTPTQPLSPPVSAEPDPGPPAAPDPARSARAADTAAINGTLQRYADAYEKRDAAAVLKVLPALTSSQLRDLERDFSNYRSYRVEITDIRIALRNGTATVMCTVVRSFETRSGLEGGNRVPTVFHLRKVGATWIIEGLESR